MKIVLAVTGASGTIYATTLAKALKESRCELHIVVSESAGKVMEYELPDALEALKKYGTVYNEKQIDAGIASGSFGCNAVVICPCSMNTLASVAHGFSNNLITRVADVAIKEGQKLVLVPREMPFSVIHLENMLKLARLGVIILPACPGFYHKPKTIQDLANHVAGKVMDSLKISNNLFNRWK